MEFEKWVAGHFHKQGFEVRKTKTTGCYGIELFLINA
ncbi:MAG: restriction endonuclease [Sphingobacteriales bacterium]